MKHWIMLGIILCAALAVYVQSTGAAGVPDPAASSVDACLVTCPAGDTSFSVVVRDVTGAPVPGSVVEISFCNCAGQQLCNAGASCGDGTFDIMQSLTNAAGQVTFSMAAGGACPGSQADISADGILLAQRDVKAMDVDGNFVVDASDFPDFSNLANDYNCDGVVNLSDLAEFNVHAGPVHQCDGPVHNHEQSWGSVKSRWP